MSPEVPFVGSDLPGESLMIYRAVEILSGLDRVISAHLTVSVRLRTERTPLYHNKHQGLWTTVSVHQLMTESVESEFEWLVTAGTGEMLRQLMGCFLSATAERLTVPLA